MNTNLVKVARGLAFVVTLIMVYYFLTSSEKVFDADNPFMVPDVSFAVLVTLSALLPTRLAVPAMMFSFSLAAGVISVSFFNHLADDNVFDVANFALLIGLLVASSLLAWVIVTDRSPSKT